MLDWLPADNLILKEELPVDTYESDRKTCVRCGLDRPELDFGPDERYDDLLNPTCRLCMRELARERGKREHVKAARRASVAARRKRDPAWARAESERVKAWRKRKRLAP